MCLDCEAETPMFVVLLVCLGSCCILNRDPCLQVASSGSQVDRPNGPFRLRGNQDHVVAGYGGPSVIVVQPFRADNDGAGSMLGRLHTAHAAFANAAATLNPVETLAIVVDFCRKACDNGAPSIRDRNVPPRAAR